MSNEELLTKLLKEHVPPAPNKLFTFQHSVTEKRRTIEAQTYQKAFAILEKLTNRASLYIFVECK